MHSLASERCILSYNSCIRICTHEKDASVSSVCICRCTHERGVSEPPKKLLGSGVSILCTPFCLICTISSELTCIFIFTHLSAPGLISAGFQWTGSTPAGFQEAFRAARKTHEKNAFVHANDLSRESIKMRSCTRTNVSFS